MSILSTFTLAALLPLLSLAFITLVVIIVLDVILKPFASLLLIARLIVAVVFIIMAVRLYGANF